MRASPDSPGSLWFCLQLPALGLEVFTRSSYAAAAARPCVLLDRNRVVACNDAARQRQIAPGTTLATAHGISHDLVHFVRDPERERRRLRFLADAAYAFSGAVSIDAPDCILLEAGGSLKLFGGLYRLKRALLRQFAALGHALGIGIAHTPLAAMAFARAGHRGELPQWPSAAALKAHTARGLTRVPVRHTELEPALVERLENMGIDTLGRLLRLPKAELGRRFGTGLLDYLGRLCGTRPDPRRPIVPAEHFLQTLPLLEASRDKDGLLFPMQRLLRDLDSWLTARQLGTGRLHWRFAPLHGPATGFDVAFAEPQQHRQTLLAISQLKLDGAALPAEIMTLTLAASRLQPWQPESGELFLHGRHQRQPPHWLIDQLRARLGNAACHGLRLHDDHRPEFAWRPAPPDPRRVRSIATGGPCAGGRRTAGAGSRWGATPANGRAGGTAAGKCSAGDAGLPRADRPVWLLAAPEPVSRYRLTLLAGPERIEGGWWEFQLTGQCRQADPAGGTGTVSGGDLVVRGSWASPGVPAPDGLKPRLPRLPRAPGAQRRDYHVARHADGAHCWVFQELTSGRWFIHGYFS